jgi:competence protein ComEC
VREAWRHASLAGLAAGLAVSSLISLDPAYTPAALAAGTACWAIAVLLRRGAPDGGVLCLLAAALAGLAAGTLRLEAIDAGSLRGPPGAEVALEGHLVSEPRWDSSGASAQLSTPQGRVLVRSSQLDGLSAGEGVWAAGPLAEPDPFEARRLEVDGIAMALEADRVEPSPRARKGLAGRVDAVRERAEAALGRGMPEREAALARGFVLGQDDAIDPRTREDFKRSGLAHLLAVSGQNVILLCLLAWPMLALAGLTLRARLVVLLGLVALYVPVTGAGPSIQRAGVMGAAGLVAALAGRPSARWYALLLAAAVTLALNPRASSDIGWQLSFAAVVGIFLWTRRLAGALDGGRPPGSPRRALAEGMAMSVAATVATAPLMAHHFGTVSAGSLAANLIALPAVAPAMWLGMLSAIAGQVPAIPVEPINWLGSACLAYIAQVARWFGEPSWALREVELGGIAGLVAAYALLAAAMEAGLWWGAHRAGLSARGPRSPRMRTAALAAAGLAAIGLAAAALSADEGIGPPPERTLRVAVLDVGQGDAIVLDPPRGDAILVDSGPPGAGVPASLVGMGVERLAVALVTHDQSDHAGGLAEVLGSMPVARVALAMPAPELEALAASRSVDVARVAEGSELRSGGLRLSVLWPPRDRLAVSRDGDPSAGDPNADSIVLLAEWGHFSMLLPGDAESELTPLEPGPVDVLKVAHHGSADEGLSSLLRTSVPRVAVISSGEDNTYGHPAPETLADLAEAGVAAARTDRGGDVVIEADAAGWRLLWNG